MHATALQADLDHQLVGTLDCPAANRPTSGLTGRMLHVARTRLRVDPRRAHFWLFRPCGHQAPHFGQHGVWAGVLQLMQLVRQPALCPAALWRHRHSAIAGAARSVRPAVPVRSALLRPSAAPRTPPQPPRPAVMPSVRSCRWARIKIRARVPYRDRARASQSFSSLAICTGIWPPLRIPSGCTWRPACFDARSLPCYNTAPWAQNGDSTRPIGSCRSSLLPGSHCWPCWSPRPASVSWTPRPATDARTRP